VEQLFTTKFYILYLCECHRSVSMSKHRKNIFINISPKDNKLPGLKYGYPSGIGDRLIGVGNTFYYNQSNLKWVLF